jgi:hypothetical protein
VNEFGGDAGGSITKSDHNSCNQERCKCQKLNKMHLRQWSRQYPNKPRTLIIPRVQSHFPVS